MHIYCYSAEVVYSFHSLCIQVPHGTFDKAAKRQRKLGRETEMAAPPAENPSDRECRNKT